MYRPVVLAVILLVPYSFDGSSLRAADTAADGVIEIELGATIQRTWDQVKADNYAYGPKQRYDATTGETHIYLPYGNNRNLYHEVRGTLYDPKPGAVAKFHSPDGNTNAVLCFKLHFDRPIGEFRFAANWSELGLAPSTVAGVEYSDDGRNWRAIREVRGADKAGGIVEPLVRDFKATGLLTQTLYIRCFSRDPANPEASGPGRWLQIWMAGDPSWGDAATTFFERQLQLWVGPAKGSAGAGEEATSVRPVQSTAALPAQASGGPVGAGFFGIASGGESFGDHPRLFPLLRDAGVTMVRSFPEWANFQPERGKWDWAPADALVQDARKNRLQIAGVFMYLAPWASSAAPDADHGDRTRTFPIKDGQSWRDFVEAVVSRYRNDVTYWEVYNEFNSPGFARKATVKDYVAMVRDAHEVAKKANPQCKIGIGYADVDISFLEQVIVQGADGHFDFVNVHPYSLMGAVMSGREPVFLQMAANLRKMLAKTNQRSDIALWVSEIGVASTDEPEAERKQAEAIVKAYVLCLAQDIDRVFWFEGRGPAYGPSGDFGIVRHDWTKRPSFAALRTLSSLLGARPKRLGWLNPTGQSYGFVFRGSAGPVLVTWAASDKGDRLRFPAAVTALDLAGNATGVKAEQDIALTRSPLLVTNLPEEWVAEARGNHHKPFPWLKDYRKAEAVSCQIGALDADSGLTRLSEGGDSKTVLGLVDGDHARRTDKANKMYYMYFDVDDSYASVGDNEIEITVVARRVDASKAGGCNLCYESAKGYRLTDQWWTIPAEPGWHRYRFRIKDANFANNWGWNFRIDTVSSPDDIWVKEVIVSRERPRK